MRLIRVTNRKRALLTLAVGGALTAIGFLTIGWWWGTAFLLLTLFLLCFWLAPKTLVFSLYAVLAIAWVSARLIEDVLPADGGIGQRGRGIAAGILAFLIGFAIPALFWYMALSVSTKWILVVPDTFKISWSQALKFLASRTFETAQTFLIVEEGRVLASKPPGMLSQFGGPGSLVMRPGNAVALERGGKVSRIVGPGVHPLKQFEMPLKPEETKGIVDLRPQQIEETAEVLTKDGIPLKIKFRCVYQIEPKSVTDQRPASRFPGGAATSEVLGAPEYPVYEATVRKAVLETAKEGWKGLFPWGPIGELRDVAATYTLDQFYDPAARVLKAIEEEVVKRYRPEASKYGVYFRELDVLGIEVPPGVREQMLKQWTAPLEGRIKVQEAEAERDAIIARSEAKAKSLEQLGSAQLALSDGVITIFQKLAETLPQIESERLALGFLSTVQELAGRIGRDETDALRVIRAMRTLTEGPTPRGWVITPPTSSTHIPPGSTSTIPAQLDTTEETEEAKWEKK